MSSRARGRQGESQAQSQRPPDGGAMKDTTRQRIDLVREATGCSADEAEAALKENGWDVNETVVRIIENPFTAFQTRKQKKKVKDEERIKKDKVIEVRRPSLERGPRRNSRERSRGGGGGGDRAFDRPARGARASFSAQQRPEPVTQEELAPAESDWADAPDGSEVPAPVQRSNFVRAPGQSVASPAPNPIRPGSTGAGTTMADLFKAKPAAAAAAASQSAAPGSLRPSALPPDGPSTSADQGTRGAAQPAASSSFGSAQTAQTASLLQPLDTAASSLVGQPTVGPVAGSSPPHPSASASLGPSHLDAHAGPSSGLGAIGQLPPSMAPGGPTSASATAPIGPPSRSAAVGSETSQRTPSSGPLGGVQVSGPALRQSSGSTPFPSSNPLGPSGDLTSSAAIQPPRAAATSSTAPGTPWSKSPAGSLSSAAPGAQLAPSSQLSSSSQLGPGPQSSSTVGSGATLLSTLQSHSHSEEPHRPTAAASAAAAPTLNGPTLGVELQPTADTRVGPPMADPILKGPTPGGLGPTSAGGLGPAIGSDAPTASDLQLQFGQFGIGSSGQSLRGQRGLGGLDDAPAASSGHVAADLSFLGRPPAAQNGLPTSQSKQPSPASVAVSQPSSGFPPGMGAPSKGSTSLESAFGRPPVSTGLAAAAGVPSGSSMGAVGSTVTPFSQAQVPQMSGQLPSQLQGQLPSQLPSQQGLGVEKSAVSGTGSLQGLSQHSAQRTPDLPEGPSGPMSVPSARSSSQDQYYSSSFPGYNSSPVYGPMSAYGSGSASQYTGFGASTTGNFQPAYGSTSNAATAGASIADRMSRVSGSGPIDSLDKASGAYDSISPFSSYGVGPGAKATQQQETGPHAHMARISADYSRTSSEYARQTGPSTPDYDTHRAPSHDSSATGAYGQGVLGGAGAKSGTLAGLHGSAHQTHAPAVAHADRTSHDYGRGASSRVPSHQGDYSQLMKQTQGGPGFAAASGFGSSGQQPAQQPAPQAPTQQPSLPGAASLGPQSSQAPHSTTSGFASSHQVPYGGGAPSNIPPVAAHQYYAGSYNYPPYMNLAQGHMAPYGYMPSGYGAYGPQQGASAYGASHGPTHQSTSYQPGSGYGSQPTGQQGPSSATSGTFKGSGGYPPQYNQGYAASNGYDEGLSGRSNYGKQAGDGLYGAGQAGLPHHQSHGHSRGSSHASSNPAHSHMHQDASGYGYGGQSQGSYGGYGSYSSGSQYSSQYGTSGLNGQTGPFK